MIRNFRQVLEKARERGRKRLAVPAPRSRRVLQLLEEADKTGLISPVTAGDLDQAVALARTHPGHKGGPQSVCGGGQRLCLDPWRPASQAREPAVGGCTVSAVSAVSSGSVWTMA